jgi:hypothetical protein
LTVARAWHTATLLPDGTVLVLGGIDAAGQVIDSAELFDPTAQTFRMIPTPGLILRAYHSATLLTDGTVLVAGGFAGNGTVVQSAEIWNPQTQSETLAGDLSVPRRNQSATLLSDGKVLLWGGMDTNGNNGELYDPEAQKFVPVEAVSSEAQTTSKGPSLATSIPEDGAANVPLSGFIALRFSERLDVRSVNAATATLAGAVGSVPAKVVPAEAGMLGFVTYKGPLVPGATYTLSLTGLADVVGRALPQTQIRFTTAQELGSGDDEVWVPNGRDFRIGQLGLPSSKLPPLQAPPGVTALAGQVLNPKSTSHRGRIKGEYATVGHAPLCCLDDGERRSALN